jgi:N-acetylglucosamine kinase-like BadF-type ATPase
MLFIGVDGGGTKTEVALFGKDGSCLGLAQTGTSNHEVLPGSFTEAASVICACAEQLLLEHNLSFSDVTGWFMGLAGIDTELQAAQLKACFETKNFRNVVLFNDGYLAVLAGSANGAGIAYNLGTGTCTAGINERGERSQIGGIGDFSGDTGSGYWIHRQVWRAAYDHCFTGGPATVIAEMLEKITGMSGEEAFRQSVYLKTAEQDILMNRIIGLFFNAWDTGDPVARDIGNLMAARGARMITALAGRLELRRPFDIILSGSVNTKAASAAYLQFFREEVSRSCKGPLRFVLLDTPPVMGCVKYVRQFSSNLS